MAVIHTNGVVRKTRNLLYNGLKYGIFSWVGLFFCIVAFIVGAIIYGIISLDEYIENKLKNE